MIRWSVLAAGATLIAGAAFVTGTSVPPRAQIDLPQVEQKLVVGQKIGFFNMAAVMHDFKKATNQVMELNTQRGELSAKLIGWRERHVKLQEEIKSETNAEQKEELRMELVDLSRKIEDEDRKINKVLNERATAIISSLYDDVHAVVVDMAHERGLSAVLAYPDAITKEELNSPMIKELKLKPPACQPFYLDPSVDYTGEVIQKLNAKFAANGEK